MKLIKLTKGQYAKVSDRDYAKVKCFKWYASKSRNTRFYACRSSTEINKRGRRDTILLHRFILNPPNDKQIDHKDGNGLNCTRKNMRICTNAENNRNKGLQPSNKSGYKGVGWISKTKKWEAKIYYRRNIYIGRFDNIIQAAKAYDKAAKKYHGKYAHLNFPE